jgi:exodeoxyribonuclease VII large subunit
MDEKIYSVHELNLEIKNVVMLNYTGKIKVDGEISNYKLSHKNIFFTLKDEESKIDVVCWGSANGGDLQNGKQVVVTGKLTCWDKQGSYQITASKIDIKGIGDLYALFLKLEKKYRNEGYFDPANKKPLKEQINRVGVITAIEGAALKDLLYVLESNKFHGDLYVKGCIVQGKDCPKSVAECIKELDKMNLDVIVITRGGGSYEDLFGFSHKEVIEAIHDATTCIISAIGHEVDTMLSDYVADIRAPTPSVAGEIIALHQRHKANVDHIFKYRDRLYMDIMTHVHKLKSDIQEMDNIIESPINIINANYNRIESFSSVLKIGISNILNEYIIELKNAIVLINSSDPQGILNGGYVMIVDADTNKMIRSGVDLMFLKDLASSNKKLKIIFKDKTLSVNINLINQ